MKLKMIPLFSFVSILFCQSTIAVIDFEANGVSQVENKALSNRLRNELVKLGIYQVVERELMDEILQEQGFQQTGCVSDECLVTVGKMIGVTKIVGGSISLVGRITTASMRMIDVETGELLKVTDYDSNEGVEDLLTRGMENVAANLSGGKNGKKSNAIIETTQKIGNSTAGILRSSHGIFPGIIRGAQTYFTSHKLILSTWRVSVGAIPYQRYGSAEISYMIPLSLKPLSPYSGGTCLTAAYYRYHDPTREPLETSGLAINGESFFGFKIIKAHVKYGMVYYNNFFYDGDNLVTDIRPFLGGGITLEPYYLLDMFSLGIEINSTEGKPAVVLQYTF